MKILNNYNINDIVCPIFIISTIGCILYILIGVIIGLGLIFNFIISIKICLLISFICFIIAFISFRCIKNENNCGYYG